MSAFELYEDEEFHKAEKITPSKSSETSALTKVMELTRGSKQPEDIFNEALSIKEAFQVEHIVRDVPLFSDYDVLVRTSSVAISGSDIHVFENGSAACPNITLGHDATGVIVKTGNCVTDLKPGDRVALEPGVACGICDFCKSGEYNMCPKLTYNGFLTQYQAHPADLCHKLPDTISMAEGTLCHTMAMASEAVAKAHITPNTLVMVMGSGPTAVASALCACAQGAKDVAVMCTMYDALKSISDNFNLKCIHYDTGLSCKNILDTVNRCFKGWPDVVINCAINEETLNMSALALRPCGLCIMAQCDTESANFNAMNVLMKNIKMVPSFRSTNMFPTAINLISCGSIPTQKLIASSYHWSEAIGAFRAAQHESNRGYKKVIVDCSKE